MSEALHSADKDAPKFDGPGTYVNGLGAVIVVEQLALSGALGRTLTLGSIWIAHAPDDLFGATPYLVTPQGMEDCGYRKRILPPGGPAPARVPSEETTCPCPDGRVCIADCSGTEDAMDCERVPSEEG